MDNRSALKELEHLLHNDGDSLPEAQDFAVLALDALRTREMKELQSNMGEWEKSHEVAFDDLLGSAVGVKENQNLLQNFKEWDRADKIENIKEDNTDNKQATVRRLPARNILRVAASLALLVSAFWIISHYASNGGDVFESYYSPFPNERIMRGDQVDQDALMQQAFSNYDAGNYIQAEVDFIELKKIVPEDQELDLYLGITYLENDKFELALQSLAEFNQNNPNELHGIWYRGLVYLKMRDTDRAKAQFDLLTNSSDSFYQQKAKQILDEIR